MRAWWIGSCLLAGCGFSLDGSVIDGGPPPDEIVPDVPPDDLVTATRVTEDLLALWTFDDGGGATIAETSGNMPAQALGILDMTSVAWSASDLTVNAPTDIATPANAYYLIAPARMSDHVTLEAWVTPANTTQTGQIANHPARIASLTVRNAGQHLISLGQSGTDWVATVRTNAMGLDGHGNPALRQSNVTAALTHLVVTSTPTERLFYVNGTKVADDKGGVLDNWKDTFVFQVAGDPVGVNTWRGTLHLLAMYKAALPEADVMRNFQAGP